jgi:hypothetical protein
MLASVGSPIGLVELAAIVVGFNTALPRLTLRGTCASVAATKTIQQIQTVPIALLNALNLIIDVFSFWINYFLVVSLASLKSERAERPN